MTLVASGLRARVGSFFLEADLDLADREVLAVVGPNGSGKTTLLRAVAGLADLEGGYLALDGEVFADPGRGRCSPPEDRPIAFVFQDYLLFPHLTVLDNVAFGLRSGRSAPRMGWARRFRRSRPSGAGPSGRPVTRSAARAEAMGWLERMGLAGLASSKPNTLSGGQRQRTAIARALATRPTLLLLDEPLAAADAAARAELRRSVRDALADFDGMALVVTHDPVDAFSLSDRIMVLEHGAVVQLGTVDEVVSRPRSEWTATMMGLNLFRGVSQRGHVAVVPEGALHVVSEIEGDVYVAVPPRSVALHRRRPEGSPRNVWRANVASIDPLGDRVRVHLGGPLPIVAEVTTSAAADLSLEHGGTLWVSVKATELTTYSA